MINDMISAFGGRYLDRKKEPRGGEVASFTGSEWHDLALRGVWRSVGVALLGTVWQAKSVAP
jgi:hypothetical protein